ncbi:MAG: hypothetical protein Q8K05_02105 [Polaromonas sp.]|jgi:hypothetical protein|uniref:hypothetical protein n=1 Tax=Polaromonas sp. TaxID=1869339 RepID=UPI002731A728|nr:hypothetical protein [Polaromonas sp.]MDP2254844.1 hypothetical protein [Polaromonas sp.]MDP3708304.1 hypothetical protein [Polaromonas sp.]
MNVLNRIPLLWLAVIAGWLAVAPVWPEPHLMEKLRMLFAGTLERPLDVFDLLLHASPLLLLVWRVLRWYRMRKIHP